MTFLAKVRRLLVTASYLRLGQVIGQLRVRLVGFRSAKAIQAPDRRRTLTVSAFLQPPGGITLTGTAVFLNSRPLALDAGVDWRSSDRPKLWRYNLHYFDYINWPVLSAEIKASLIDRWISFNKPGSEDAWEPYPISVRAVNWVKFFWGRNELEGKWVESLALQLAWLERNLEYNLLANHLLKNAKALAFGGLFFSGRHGDSMLKNGLQLISEQGREQLLPDGGHFERSAMYHAIVLEDYLDLVNVLSLNPELVSKAKLDELVNIAVRAWHYFSDVLAADGEIPLFNDAAFGITPPAANLLDYGRRVLGPALPQVAPSADPLRVFKPDSGYFGYRYGGDSLLIDCGPGGPDYQPGHTHADTLSYELCIDGRRIVVDSGVFDYEDNDLRHYLRGTAAHNTVRIDGIDQSEVWGAFRVARRARPLYAELGPWEGASLEFRGAHDGYRRLPGRVVHERRICAHLAGTWEVEDRITGSGQHRLESFIHLHPECSLQRVGEKQFAVSASGKPVARIDVTCEASVEVTSGCYCPEFGRKVENAVLVISVTTELPATLGYTIRKA